MIYYLSNVLSCVAKVSSQFALDKLDMTEVTSEQKSNDKKRNETKKRLSHKRRCWKTRAFPVAELEDKDDSNTQENASENEIKEEEMPDDMSKKAEDEMKQDNFALLKKTRRELTHTKVIFAIFSKVLVIFSYSDLGQCP